MPDTTTHLMWFTINYPHGLLPFILILLYTLSHRCVEGYVRGEDTYPSVGGEQKFEIKGPFLHRLCREISFQFRTRLPHGLLVYHNVKNPEGIDLDPYALYVIVEKGQLKVVHVFGKHSTSVTVGEALNRDEWHSVMVSLSMFIFPFVSCLGRSCYHYQPHQYK